MVEVNVCDLRCPKRAMMAVKYRQDMAAQSNPLGRLATNIGTGLRGVGQVARAAATCSSRHLSGDQWHASPECIAEAQGIADGMPRLTRSVLTESENAILANIRFKGDPPTAK
jgi:hypothetical protein